MMKHNIIRALTISALLIAAPLSMASAADMAVKAPPSPPICIWCGFYVGANGGYAWERNQSAVISAGSGTGTLFSFPAIGGVPTTGTTSFSASGGFGGVQAGYNFQPKANWLLGVESDIQAASIRGSATGPIKRGFSDPFFGLPDWAVNTSTKVEWFGTARARLGVLPTNSLLFYVTGGLAYGEVERTGSLSNTFVPPGITTVGGTFSCLAGTVCFTQADHQTQVGWTAGVGAEYAFWSRVSLKAEYLHVDLGGGRTFLLPATQPPGGATMIAAFASGARFDLVRVGLNVHLDGPPVVGSH